MADTINKSEAFALLLKMCPGAGAEWEEHQLEWQGEDAPYLGMAVFAHHLVDLMGRGETKSFPEVFAVVERLIVEGNEEVRDLAVVGFLESLQNSASWTTHGYDSFLPWLKPYTRAVWNELEKLWAGKNSLADVVRSERQSEN